PAPTLIPCILLEIASPSSLTFRSFSHTSSSNANAHAAVPRTFPHDALPISGYKGVTLTILQASYDQGIKNVKVVRANATTYCVQNTVPGTVSYHKVGPSCDIISGVC